MDGLGAGVNPGRVDGERPRTGARGVLLDEYERAIRELQHVICGLDDATLAFELHPEADSAAGRSIGSVLEHVVRAGNAYPTFIRRQQTGDASLAAPVRTGPRTAEAFARALDDAFAYTVATLAAVREDEMIHRPLDKLVVTPWGQRFDYDQLMEHAIVHVLRHRRQIERFLGEMPALRATTAG